MFGKIDSKCNGNIRMDSLLAKAKKNKTLAPAKARKRERDFNTYIKAMMKKNGHIHN